MPANIKDVPIVMVLLCYFSRYGAWHMDVRIDIQTGSLVASTIFEIDGLPNFLSMVLHSHTGILLLRVVPFLLAEALFLVFGDGRKETPVMSSKLL